MARALLSAGAMLLARRRIALSLLLVACSSGCAAQQQRAAGATVQGVGLLTSVGGLGVALGCTPFAHDTDGDGATCDDDNLEPDLRSGVTIMAVGVGLIVAGALLWEAAKDDPEPDSSVVADSTR